MAFPNIEIRLGMARAALFGATVLGMPFAAAGDVPVKTGLEQQYAIDLGLTIDEAGFLQAAAAGPQFGTIIQSLDKTKMDCLNSYGDFCVAAASPSFKVAINKPMADFIMKKSGLFNPSLPTRMIFVEDWLDVTKEEHAGGYTAIADDGSDQVVAISLKSAALEAFKSIDPTDPHFVSAFNGAISFVVSYSSAHEWAHGGAQTKALLEPGMIAIPDNLADTTLPQVYSFSDKYIDLYRIAFNRNLGKGALLFGVSLESGIDARAYRARIFQEARDLGILK